MSDLKTVSLFDTFVYQTDLPEYLEDKDFMAVCDEHINKAIDETKGLIYLTIQLITQKCGYKNLRLKVEDTKILMFIGTITSQGFILWKHLIELQDQFFMILGQVV